MKGSADFSPCRTYRYTLRRVWDETLPRAVFVLLNPSTADAEVDDPTLRRGIGYARRWGYGSVAFVNLFAFRSTHPAIMKAAADPIGPSNGKWLMHEADRAGIVVAAWGAHGGYMGRCYQVAKALPRLHHLGTLTRDGHPRHILYLRGDLEPQPWEGYA